MAKPLSARAAALALVLGVVKFGRTLSDQTGVLARLQPRDRAHAGRLAAAVLRHSDDLDAWVARFSKKRPGEPGRSALRLAGWDLASGTAAHAAVGGAVEAVKSASGGQRQAGFVNAVARQMASQPIDLRPNKLPSDLRAALIEDHGRAAVEAMETVFGETPPIDLTVKSGDTATWAARLGGVALPTGSVRVQPGQALSELPGYAEGEWWVQDAAAALPARFLDVAPGETVLDLCAAPGGKTMQLAAAGGQVTAVDQSEARLKRLRGNLARVGFSADVIAADALDYEPPHQFDAILLDAPCSATGTIRRHPDLPHLRAEGLDPGLPGLQAAMLDRAAHWLKPGGRLVFATCSLLHEEGEAHLEGAIERDLKIDAIELPGIDPDWKTPEGALRIRPDHWAAQGGIDGFFIARFLKI